MSRYLTQDELRPERWICRLQNLYEADAEYPQTPIQSMAFAAVCKTILEAQDSAYWNQSWQTNAMEYLRNCYKDWIWICRVAQISEQTAERIRNAVLNGELNFRKISLREQYLFWNSREEEKELSKI